MALFILFAYSDCGLNWRNDVVLKPGYRVFSELVQNSTVPAVELLEDPVVASNAVSSGDAPSRRSGSAIRYSRFRNLRTTVRSRAFKRLFIRSILNHATFATDPVLLRTDGFGPISRADIDEGLY